MKLAEVVLRPSVTAAAGLIGGFALARTTRREVGGAVLLAAGAWSTQAWARRSGPVAATCLGLLYLLAFGGSHPLAKKLGAWPSVFTVAALTAGASEAVAITTGRAGTCRRG